MQKSKFTNLRLCRTELYNTLKDRRITSRPSIFSLQTRKISLVTTSSSTSNHHRHWDRVGVESILRLFFETCNRISRTTSKHRNNKNILQRNYIDNDDEQFFSSAESVYILTFVEFRSSCHEDEGYARISFVTEGSVRLTPTSISKFSRALRKTIHYSRARLNLSSMRKEIEIR